MSSDAHAPGGDHAHDAHAFDGEPSQALPVDEKPTPGWLPLVGLALFLIAAVAFASTQEKASGTESAAAAPTATAAAAAAAPRPAQIEARPAPRPMPMPMPPAGATGAAAAAAPAGSVIPPGIQKLTPTQIEDLKKRIEEARAKRGVAPAGTQNPAP